MSKVCYAPGDGFPKTIKFSEGDRVVSTDEGARLLGISKWTLLRLAKSEKIKVLHLSARRRGVLLSEIGRYLHESAQAAA